MKERPILFSAPMVRAIIEGRKTMTRRVASSGLSDYRLVSHGTRSWNFERGNPGVYDRMELVCPYGQPGDRLWVREGFWYPDDGKKAVFYRELEEDDPRAKGYPWRPSIFMPRWASRILLEVTAVHVERVQEITEEDAKAEGANFKELSIGLLHAPESLKHEAAPPQYPDPYFTHRAYRYGFFELWDSINAKRGYSWDANPWVWVVEFGRVDA